MEQSLRGFGCGCLRWSSVVKRFLATYSLAKPRWERSIRLSRPKVFRGLTKIIPGMREPDEESIEYFRVVDAPLVIFRDPGFFFRGRRGMRYKHLVLLKRRKMAPHSSFSRFTSEDWDDAVEFGHAALILTARPIQQR